MKINLSGKPEVIVSNPYSHQNYFGWPSVARLQDGRIAVVCSGFRAQHVCPFGKACISYSDDNGKTYIGPTPVIDTPLDDRDAGITPFGESGFIITSFNNTRKLQHEYNPHNKFFHSYLDTVTDEEENRFVGSEFRITKDSGRTYGEIYISPVTSPHGPLCLNDGTILWVGRAFSSENTFEQGEQGIRCYTVGENGAMKKIGEIPDIPDGYSCEPHTVQLKDGTLICHIRNDRDFSTWQAESYDSGKSWSNPHPVLPPHGGAPAHLLLHSSGVLMSVYGYREMPYGIKAMFSLDGGKTWDKDYVIYETPVSDDLGYPATIELDDGSLLTVFYAHPEENSPAVIMQQKWSFNMED